MRSVRKKVVSAVIAMGMLAAMCAGITRAATTIAPTYPGNVVRDNSVTITTMPMATAFQRSLATSNWTIWSPLVAGSSIGCRGDNGAMNAVGSGNNGPRTTLTVTGPGGISLLDAVSPAIDVSLAGAFAGYPPLAVQPAYPGSTTAYRGVPQAASPAPPGATRPMVHTIDLTGKPAGIYTVTTVRKNIFKQGSAACTIGTAIPGTTANPSTAPATPGLITDVQTFEYRPWQHVFTDVFGGGGVNMNIIPKEFQAKVGNQTGAIYSGATEMRMFALPSVEPGADPLPFMLPSDPTTCAGDPQSCLPSTAIECPEATAACVPRIVVINRAVTNSRVQGVFDLQTKAFIAWANANGNRRLLVSLGTENDAAYHDLLAQLSAAAAAQGIDLMSLLATKVRVRPNEAMEISLSLLNGLQIQPNPGQPVGVQIVSDFTAQAGLILNIYASLGGPVCTATAGDSDPTSAAPDRYTHSSDAGYTVEKSDLLPEVPRVGPAGALVGGPIYHIEGDFVGAAPALVNTSTAVIGVDTADDEPNGYPIWVEPFLSTPANVTVAKTMDFIGTATWSASETPITGVGCLTVDFMLGAGVALYNNPLPLGFGDIPIWDPQSPEVQALMAQINAAVQDAVDQVVGNPTVTDVLDQVLGLLPEVPGAPALP